MKEIKKLAIVLGCVLLFVVYYFLCAGSARDARNDHASGSSTAANALTGVSVEDQVHEYVVHNLAKEVRITGTGDIMFYD